MPAKAAKKKPRQPTRKRNEEILVDVVRALRKNPEKYRKVAEELKRCRTDKARAKALIEFATNERELAALLPITAPQVEAAAWTTVTVTTVIVIVDSAY